MIYYKDYIRYVVEFYVDGQPKTERSIVYMADSNWYEINDIVKVIYKAIGYNYYLVNIVDDILISKEDMERYEGKPPISIGVLIYAGTIIWYILRYMRQ